MSHRLTSAIKKNDKDVPITKIRPGVFALREWEEKKGKKGAAAAAPERRGRRGRGQTASR